jgi:hypothetical protein
LQHQNPQTYSFIAVPVCDDTLAADGTATADPDANKEMEYQLLKTMQLMTWNLNYTVHL